MENTKNQITETSTLKISIHMTREAYLRDSRMLTNRRYINEIHYNSVKEKKNRIINSCPNVFDNI